MNFYRADPALTDLLRIHLKCLDARRAPGRQLDSPRNMGRYRKPAAVLPRPAIGVAAKSLLPVRRHIAGSGVNDRKIADHANFDVMRLEVFDRHRYRRLL